MAANKHTSDGGYGRARDALLIVIVAYCRWRCRTGLSSEHDPTGRLLPGVLGTTEPHSRLLAWPRLGEAMTPNGDQRYGRPEGRLYFTCNGEIDG